MPTLRIANANIEWMNYWFTNDSDPVAWKTTFVQDGQTNDTAKTAKRAAAMIKAIDPDVLAVQEGPSREGELALLYKPASVTSASLAPHPTITGLIDPWEADVDGDMLLEPDYHFTRNPLIVNLKLGAHRLQIIVMHTKSSFVNHGAAMWNDPVTRHDYVVAALKARRRNGTEGMRVREYLAAQLGTDSQAAIIVAGDLNDGPGLDYFEKRYLAHNITDIVLGSAFQPEWVFQHTQHDVPANNRYTAVFDDFVENINNKKPLLDHVLLSPGLLTPTGLRKVADSGKIHHTEYNAQVSAGGHKRENRPSDHRPVSVRLRY